MRSNKTNIKVVHLEARIKHLEQQLDEVIGFLNEAIKMRKKIDIAEDDHSIDHLLP